jgi:hypothetical protein
VVDGGSDLHPQVAVRRMGTATGDGPGTRHGVLDSTSVRALHKAAGAARRGDLKLSEIIVSAWTVSWRFWHQACVIADGAGPSHRCSGSRRGQAHELAHAILLLGILPDVPKWVVGNRGYTSDSFRGHTWKTGMADRPGLAIALAGICALLWWWSFRWKGAATLKCCGRLAWPFGRRSLRRAAR